MPTAPPATIQSGGAAPPAIALKPVVSGLSAPVDIASARDGSGRLFVVTQNGLIWIVEPDDSLVTQPFLDVRDRISTGGEQGLLGLAFHPDYGCNGRFFIDYTDKGGDTVVEEYRVSADNPNRAESAAVAPLLHIEQPFPNHNGGDVVFGPDGFLYIGMGDGGSGGDPQGNGQRLDTLLGKLLRIDVDDGASGAAYGIPPGNCAGCPVGARPEIYAYGLRNPWRFSFDRATGGLWIGDVGQGAFEEIDHVPATTGSGANFGWNRMEGLSCYPDGAACDEAGLTLPVAVYDHASGDCSISGGYVYRGSAFPKLAGWYLAADYCSGTIRALGTGRGATMVTLLQTGRSLVTFGEDEAGELYVADVGAGSVFRIVAAP